MNLEQLALQLGLAGVIVLVGYRLALVFIDRWGKSEDRRTDAIQAGFSSLAHKLDTHATADQSSHAEIRDRVSRLEGKIDNALDWQERTPVNAPIPQPPGKRTATPARGAPVQSRYHLQRPNRDEDK